MGAVLVDLEGSLAVIEKTYDLCAASLGQDGVGYCTNHFLDPVMKGTVSIAHEGLEENSNVRYRTLTKLFMENDWSRTLEGMKDSDPEGTENPAWRWVSMSQQLQRVLSMTHR